MRPAHRRTVRASRAASLGAALVATVLLTACTAADPADLRQPTASSSTRTDGAGADAPAGADGTDAPDVPAGAGATAPATGESKIPESAAQGFSQPPPSPAPDVVRLHLPLPKAASANGKVVAGFPTAIVPIPRAADIVATSVTGQGDRLQFALQASSAAAPADVVASYRTSLTGSGFVEEPTAATEGSIAASFVRDDGGIVVSVRTALGGGSQISVAGTLQAAT